MSRRSLGVVTGAGLAVLLGAPSRALAQVAPSLGTAGSYSVLAGSQVTNVGATTISGDVGISPGIGPAPHFTGFGTVTLGGVVHDADVAAANAQGDKNTAYGALDQGCTVTFAGAFQELAGLTLVPGVYCATSFHLTGGTLTLSGTASDVWIFKSSSDLVITGGAPARVLSPSCSVWWRVVSSATFDAGSSLVGNILADTSITLAAGASLSGRALARTAAVTLSSNSISTCVAPVVPPVLPPSLAKAFSPVSIGLAGISTLTVTLSNPNATIATLTAVLTDTLPSGLTIAGAPNASTTCSGSGTVSATPGGTSITLPTTRSIPAGSGATAGTCDVSVDVTGLTAGSYLNTLAANSLQTSNGNNAVPVSATLTIVPTVPTLAGWAMIMLTALLALAGYISLRRKARQE